MCPRKTSKRPDHENTDTHRHAGIQARMHTNANINTNRLHTHAEVLLA